MAEGQVVCEHIRVVERAHDVPRRTVYDRRHYLAVIQRKPGALRNGAPFAETPKAFRRLQAQLLQRPGGDREMADILALVLQHNESAVLCAVELALEDRVATKTHVLMLRGLKMFGMAQAVGELAEQGAPAFEATVPTLSQLLKAEMAEREVRSIACHKGGAVPGLQGPDKIRFSRQRGQRGHRAPTAREKAANKAGHLAEQLIRLDLVILDELGYLPFSSSGGALLFHLLSKLYKRTSVAIIAA